MYWNQSAEQTEEITKTLVYAHAEEIVKSTVKDNVLKKKVAPDVPVYYNLFAVERELLMIISVI